MNTLHSKAPLTVGDFVTELGLDPQYAHAIFQEVEAAVHPAAERLAAVVEQIAGRLQNFVERVSSLLQARQTRAGEADAWLQDFGKALISTGWTLLPMVERIFRKIPLFVKAVEDTPKVDGHEDLLIGRLRYHPLAARLIVHAAHKFGEQYASERNFGRKVGASVRRLAKAGLGPLAISRRAAKLREQMRNPNSDLALHMGIEKARLRLSLSDFKDLVDRAAGRNLRACQALGEVCGQLAPMLPSSHGRPLATVTAVHASFLLFLDHVQVFGAYTYDAVHKDDEVDDFTLSTRTAFNMKRFRPQSAVALLFSGELGEPTRARKRRRNCEPAARSVRSRLS